MNLQPPIVMKFETIGAAKIASCRAGICPHCVFQTLVSKHLSGQIEFLQCSKCKVVVALERL